jgi:hypothetical protein
MVSAPICSDLLHPVPLKSLSAPFQTHPLNRLGWQLRVLHCFNSSILFRAIELGPRDRFELDLQEPVPGFWTIHPDTTYVHGDRPLGVHGGGAEATE